MIFHKTKIKGAWIIELEPRIDKRGFYTRNFAKEEFAKQGIDFDVIHINRSFNKKKGTTRGFHYQLMPKSEDKILQVLRGKVYDVVLDLRKKSKTYGQWFSVELNPKKMNIVLCPKGCANAIQVLENNSELQYFSSAAYSPENERGIRFNDPYFKIKWPFKKPTVISEKDSNWPLVKKENLPVVDLKTNEI